MDSAKDFDADLQELKTGIEIGDILAAINAPKTKSPTPANNRSPASAKASPNEAAKPTPQPARRPPPRRPAAERPVFKNVTTKLTPETKERVRQAAKLQAAHGREPNTEYGILNQAAEEWLKRHGYAGRCKSEETAPQEAEPSEEGDVEER